MVYLNPFGISLRQWMNEYVFLEKMPVLYVTIYDETELQRDIPPISLHPPNLVMIYGDLSSVAR